MKKQSPTTVACKHLYSSYVNFRYSPTSCWKAPNVDRRTKFGKAVLAEYHRLKDEKLVLAAIAKQKQRRESKPKAHTNILDCPLVRDWKSNKGRYGFMITAERIMHGSRNHWAKSDRDKKILAVLAGK